jgi:hypothetical protein
VEGTDYATTTSPGAKTFTALKDLRDGSTVAADTQLSEEEWNQIPEESRAAWVEGTDYKIDATPDVMTYTALNNLSAEVLLAPGAEITDEIWNKMTPAQRAKLKKGKDYRYLRGYRFRKLLVGADNRWSTSKFQALIWTYAIVFGLLALIFAKWMGNSQGWDALMKMKTDDWDVYLVLLGGPFAAFVLARLTTSTKTDNGTIDKTTAPTSTLNPIKGLGQVLGNDSGQADLGDTQYFVFNLVAVMYFLGTLTGNLQEGFPPLPALLVGLTSVSAATYVTKKAVERAQPSLKSVVPPTREVGKSVDVWGSFLVAPSPTSPPPADWGPRATVGGIEAPAVVVVPNAGTTDHLRITIPKGASGSAPIVVYTATGTATDPLDFTVRTAEQDPP